MSRYIEQDHMMSKLKPCPYRIYGERRISLTVSGEYYYSEYFMPCMEKECACFHTDGDEAYCDRNGAYMRLGNWKGADDGNK